MSSYLNKSEIYLDSAKQLKESGCYAVGPHCAYYSCFLRMQDIWYNKLGHTEFDLHTTPEGNYLGEGDHKLMINKLGIILLGSNDRNAKDLFKVFNDKIGQLKKLRLKADYKDEDILNKDCSNAIDLAEAIIPILKNNNVWK